MVCKDYTKVRMGRRGWLQERGGAPPRAPELLGRPQDWLNTGNKALRLYGQGGILETSGVCLIDFWEYTCVNCLRTLPYLKEWDKRYRSLGLTIVGIHTPEFEFARLKDNVVQSVKTQGINYPVLVDSDYLNWNAWSNNFWPRKFLIGPGGAIAYDHAGEGAYGDTEAAIQRLLKVRNPQARMPRLLEPIRGSDQPGAVCYPQTREIYAGYGRGTGFFGSPEGLRQNVNYPYTVPKNRDIAAGMYYASGQWSLQGQNIRHARTTMDPLEDSIVLPYMALEANAVIRPEAGKPFDVFLLQDGRPIKPADKTEDTRFLPDGRSYIRVEEPRMYKLIKNRLWGKHELTLGSTSPDFALYSFTFASCVVGGAS
jgi:thiol-disulfide isomerase/thioredoxin